MSYNKNNTFKKMVTVIKLAKSLQVFTIFVTIKVVERQNIKLFLNNRNNDNSSTNKSFKNHSSDSCANCFSVSHNVYIY